MIRFIAKPEEPETLTFANVQINQFFICEEGYLCQKENAKKYNYLAKPNGEPFCFAKNNADENTPITKILPEVTKIEF